MNLYAAEMQIWQHRQFWQTLYGANDHAVLVSECELGNSL